ncbi:Panacea domain-containing protein [Brevibacillus sp. TJ4]|uniref:Panacea domain-containing protein n=1 Tax=Brevibacillus sp. TJ4 TaxID=3234853 RepID=UPI0037D2C7E9
MVSVFTVAKYFLTRSVPNTDKAITHLKLQKLVYYAQAWYYTLFDKALFNEEIEAWVHGPVCPPLYNYYRDYGFDIIKKPNDPDETLLVINSHKNVKAVLEFVWDLYGTHTGKELEDLTHREDPWKNARKNIGQYEHSNNIITLESMKKYYRKFLSGVK